MFAVFEQTVVTPPLHADAAVHVKQGAKSFEAEYLPEVHSTHVEPTYPCPAGHILAEQVFAPQSSSYDVEVKAKLDFHASAIRRLVHDENATERKADVIVVTLPMSHAFSP